MLAGAASIVRYGLTRPSRYGSDTRQSIVAAPIVGGVNNAGGLHLAKALLRHAEPNAARP
jgi:hypothetical protein